MQNQGHSMKKRKKKMGVKNKVSLDKNEAAVVSENFTETRKDDNRLLEGMFPPGSQWFIFGMVLCFRVIYVSNKKNWWILHPDEVYQSMEVAHSELYGYGFRPYEYLGPPAVNKSLMLSEQQSRDLGMYSMRSFLYPHIFVLVQHAVMILWPNATPFLVWKQFHAVVTSTLPLFVYRFSQHFYGSHDIAVVSSLLCAFSIHLNVFGTHTIVNSFLSPILFYSIDVFLQTIQKNGKKNVWNVNESYSEASDDNYKSCDRVRQNTNDNSDIEGIKSNVIHSTKKEGLHFDYRLKESLKSQLRSQLCMFENVYSSCKGPTNYTRKDRRDGRRLSSNYRSGFPLPQITAVSELMKTIFSQRTFAGLMLGLIVYIRVDLVLFVGVFILANSFTLWESIEKVAKLQTFVLGTCLGIFFGGLQDLIIYGYWFITPTQWIKFNVLGKLSVEFFGEGSRDLYIKEIFVSNYFLIALFSISLIHFIISLWPQNRKFYHKQNLKLVFILLSMLIIYSLGGHKEIRFVHNVIVATFILYGSVIVGTVQYFYVRICKSELACCLILYSSLFLYVSSQVQNFPTSNNNLISNWTYQNIEDSSDVNECLYFVSQQDDVNGVFMDRSIHNSGGYTLLHRDVPILSLIHNEFYEFDKPSRIPIERKGLLGFDGRNLSVSSLQHISNYISVRNTPYLLKILIQKTEYNYLVMKVSRKFVDFGYTEVFRSGTMKVLRRSFSKDEERRLHDMGSAIPVGRDAGVLEFESGWLISFGLYDIAEEKLHAAISLDSTKIRLFQLLADIYSRTKKFKKREKVLQSCANIHGWKRCKTPTDKKGLPLNSN